MNISFSKDGNYFAIYSKKSNFIKVYKLNDIETILDEIRSDTFLAELMNKEEIDEVMFGNNTKYLVVRYKTKMEIYHIGQMTMLKRSYVPESFELPKDQLEFICDHFFFSNDHNDAYRCYLACKVSGMKKIKVFNIKHIKRDIIWETDANSINFFEEVADNF